MAAAITSKGELYTWGSGPLGLFTEEGVPLEMMDRPTKVIVLDEYNVLEVSVGTNHLLALVSDKKIPEKRMVFGFGDNAKGQLGCKDLTASFVNIEFFNNKKPYKVCAGNMASIVCCGEEKKGTIHTGTTCCQTGITPIKDLLFFRKDKEKGFKCWSKECLSNLPEITMATRHPIANIEGKDWPYLNEIKLVMAKGDVQIVCISCKVKIEGAIYKGATADNSSSVLCESCFMRTPSTFVPAIFYRISSPNLQGELPTYPINKFYEVASDSLMLNVTPGYKFHFPNFIPRPGLEELLAEMKEFDSTHDADILELLNDYLVQKDMKIDQISLKTELPIAYVIK